MKPWMAKALELLAASLQPPRHELNELDWKAAPSPDEKRLTERLNACYQHAVLRHFSDGAMTNQSLRERLKMPEKHRSMVSALIQEAVDQKLIKSADPENKSKKFAEYVPSWA